MYVRMYDDLKKQNSDNPTIGILLCTETDHTIAKYSILNDKEQLFASKYMPYLPTEAELIAERENITILEELNKNPNMDKNSVDKLVKKIKKLSEPSKKVLQIKEDKKLPNISWTDVFIYSIVPMGQLLARVKYLGGSLDKWYLLFLFFPPFSFIPMILMKYGIIKKDKKKSLYDNSILFPFVMKLIFPIILPLFINNNESPVLFQSILTGTFILSLFITNMYRRVVLCGSMTTDSIGKALIDSIFMEATSRSLPYIFEYIPLIGTVIRIVKRLPNVDAAYMNVASSASVVMGYLMVNLFNQTNVKKFCKKNFYGNTSDKIMLFYGTAIITVFVILNSMGGQMSEFMTRNLPPNMRPPM